MLTNAFNDKVLSRSDHLVGSYPKSTEIVRRILIDPDFRKKYRSRIVKTESMRKEGAEEC